MTVDKRLLLIDDDEGIVWVVKKALKSKGYKVTTAMKAVEGIGLIGEKFPLILLDLKLPDMDGLHVLDEIKGISPDSLVIIITAHGRMDSAIEAIKKGAYDYLEKPFDIEELKILVDKAFGEWAMKKELQKLRAKVSELEPPQMIGSSQAMLKVFKAIGRVAPKDVTVLILGESGTGKELVAKAIHHNSLRAEGPFIAINAASIPKDLLEAELFGWEKGAFTGASDKRIGKIEAANGGTLFLDEIGEMDINLQAKLLRVIDGGEFTPLGSNKPLNVDIRIMGATNKNLEYAIKEGKFREDLYYRFNVVQIKLPALKERKEDIIPLAKHFLKAAEQQLRTAPKRLSKEVEDYLVEYNWPGNVRELENTIKRASILSQGSVIRLEDIATNKKPFISIHGFLEERLKGFMKGISKAEGVNLYDTVICEVERALITIAIKETNGNQIKAARLLGINRNTLSKKIKELKVMCE